MKVFEKKQEKQQFDRKYVRIQCRPEDIIYRPFRSPVFLGIRNLSETNPQIVKKKFYLLMFKKSDTQIEIKVQNIRNNCDSKLLKSNCLFNLSN
jgi:hypothetical protein